MNAWLRLCGWALAVLLAGCAVVAPQPAGHEASAEAGDPAADAQVVQLASKAFASAPLPDWVLPENARFQGRPAPVYFTLFDVQYRYRPDGRSERFVHLIVGGTDGNRMQNEGLQAISFDPRYESVVLHRVHLWRAGERLDVSARVRPRFLVNDTVRNTIYQGRVNAVFQVPDYRVGDRLEFAWTTVSKNPLFSGQVFAFEGWSLAVAPIWNRRAVFHIPETLPVRVSVAPHSDARRTRSSKIERQETSAGGMRQITLVDRNLPLLATESDAARGALQNDILLATSVRDWAAVTAWAQALFEQVPAPQGEEYRALVADWRRIENRAARAVAALQWVQREIRYVSMSFGENSHRPHTPDETLARRYGDCKDVSLLLVRLLRDLDIEAQPALMRAANGRLPARLDASPMLFDHAVAVVWIDGRMTVLDGTQRGQVSALEHLGSVHGGADLLVVGGAHAGFLRAPYTGNEEDRTLRVTEKIDVKDEGASGVLTQTVIYRGTLAEEQRRRIQASEAAVLRRNYLADISRLYPDAEVLTGPAVSDDKARNEVKVVVSYKIPEPFKRSGPNWRHEYRSGAFAARLPRVINSKREVPLALPFNVQRVVLEHTLEAPAAFRIDEEAFVENVDIPALRAQIKRERPAPTRLVDRLELELRADEVPGAAIADYRRAVQPLLDFRSEVRLKRVPGR